MPAGVAESKSMERSKEAELEELLEMEWSSLSLVGCSAGGVSRTGAEAIEVPTDWLVVVPCDSPHPAGPCRGVLLSFLGSNSNRMITNGSASCSCSVAVSSPSAPRTAAFPEASKEIIVRPSLCKPNRPLVCLMKDIVNHRVVFRWERSLCIITGSLGISC